MNIIYLALIFGLYSPPTPAAAGVEPPAQYLQLSQDTQPQSDAPQSGSSPDAPPPPTGSGQAGSEKTGLEQAPSASPAPDAVPQPKTAQPNTPKKPESKPSNQAKAPTKKHRRRKPATADGTVPAQGKKVVRNGGTADPALQLGPRVTDEQASRQRQSTTQLLATTDTNLKQISTRQLGPSQQESVSQIRKYIEQAKAAEAAGDVQRAQNLASKALLLSDDLVKH